MIKTKDLNLVKFAQDVYSLSAPQGLGFLHVREGGLSVKDAQELVVASSKDKRIALDLDYVHGRACKMTVFRTENGYELTDSWYDHSNAQYDDLLARHGIERKDKEPEKQAEGKGLGLPVGCTLEPMLKMAILMGDREHPCDRCNSDRKVCKGYARKENRR